MHRVFSVRCVRLMHIGFSTYIVETLTKSTEKPFVYVVYVVYIAGDGGAYLGLHLYLYF